MAPTTGTKRLRAHPLAPAALATAVVASAFALYGSFLSEQHLAGSPLNVARSDAGLEVTRTSEAARYWIQFAAYGLPFGLGLAAALAGAAAMRAIERAAEPRGGNWQAVFAIMIGGLAAVVSGSMLFAVYGWKYVPTLYTY